MIKITVSKKGELVNSIQAQGHSGYADEGSDIICSAVSTLIQNAEKGLKELLKIQTEFILDVDKPYLKITLPEKLDYQSQHDAQIILKSTLLGLSDLADSYPKYINIKEH